jgi:hypothetical protein
MFGVPYFLQAFEPQKNPLAPSLLAQFDAEIAKFRGRAVGSGGVQVLMRGPSTDSLGNWTRGGGR